MERVLLLTHTDVDGLLPKATFETLNAVQTAVEGLDQAHFTIGIIGRDVQEAANRLAGFGAECIWGVSGPEFEHSRYATDASAAETICRKAEATLVLAPATSRLARILPGVAYRLGGRIDTHATEVAVANGVVRIERWCYRQRMEVRMHRTHRPWIITTDPGSLKPRRSRPGSVQIEFLSVETPEVYRRTKTIGVDDPPEDEQTIRSEASLLFVAGAGWTKPQDDGKVHAKRAEGIILDFLKKSRASLGCSKSLVDIRRDGQPVLSFLTHMNQVGQTGSTPRHPKGLATCCHGEEPHVVGWRFIDERRAINLEANCGWAQGKADVLYVADAFEVMAKVNQLLKEESEAPARADAFEDAPLKECVGAR